MPHALIVDDDRNTLIAFAELVEAEGYSTTTAETLEAARVELTLRRPDVVLCDLVLPDGKGTDLLGELQGVPSPEVILITANATIETAVAALRLGAHDYLTKPVDIARLKTLLAQLRRTQALKDEVSTLRNELRQLGRFGPLVGTSPAMQQAYELISRVAPTDVTVLIIGESGTGKELVAESVYRLSRRRGQPFLAVNCGALAATLIESELFGHERGSFTGAERRHQGVFERANGGTLFLDEITEMPIELQVRLLRVLETGTMVRVGGDKELHVDCRVIAATNRDPESAVKAGTLRQDLYYRLQVFPLRLPPLREREGDIAVLARHFLAERARAENAEKHFTQDAMNALVRYQWPGNVRELKNVVDRAYILADEEITRECLPPEISGEQRPTGPFFRVRVGAAIADVEKRLILATLRELGGDKRRAAEALGVSLKTLYNRLHVYGEKSEGAAAGPREDE